MKSVKSSKLQPLSKIECQKQLSEIAKLLEHYQHAYSISYQLNIIHHYKYYKEKILALLNKQIEVMNRYQLHRMLEDYRKDINYISSLFSKSGIGFEIENDQLFIKKEDHYV